MLGQESPGKPRRRFVEEAAGVSAVWGAALLAWGGTEPNRQRVRAVKKMHQPTQPLSSPVSLHRSWHTAAAKQRMNKAQLGPSLPSLPSADHPAAANASGSSTRARSSSDRAQVCGTRGSPEETWSPSPRAFLRSSKSQRPKVNKVQKSTKVKEAGPSPKSRSTFEQMSKSQFVFTISDFLILLQRDSASRLFSSPACTASPLPEDHHPHPPRSSPSL
jgi:hypothetical protein